MSETVIGAGQVLEPNKKTFTNYRAPVLSYELREAMVGVLNPGCYCGFDTIKATEVRENVYAVTISHEKTGVVKTVYLTQEQGGGAGVSMPTGLFVTRFGTIVHDSLPIEIAEVNLPVDGLYLLYAEYDRPTVGTTENNVVGDIRYDVVKIDQDSEDEYIMSGSGDTLNFRNEILNMIQTPVAIIRRETSNHGIVRISIESGKFGADWLKPGSGYTPLSGIEIHRENNTDWGKLTLQDLETSLGCFGVGRFKYLGRTLYSLWDLINKQFRWDDIDTKVVQRVVEKIGGSFNPLLDPDGRFNGNDDAGSDGKPDTIEYRNQTYHAVYIKVQSIWDNLMTLDAEAQELWAQMGYRDKEPYDSTLEDDRTQPETEKILLAERTIWENLYKIRHYINTEDDKIWERLGLSRNPNEDKGKEDSTVTVDGKELVKKFENVWINIYSIADFLKTLYEFVHEDERQPEGEGGVVSNIKALWAQLGYDKDNDSDNPNEPYHESGMSVNKTIWENLTTLYSYQKTEIENMENRLKQANNFIIVTKKAKLGKGGYAENNIIRPGALTESGAITPQGYDDPKTYLYVIDEMEDNPSSTESTDHYIKFEQPENLDKENSRVAFVIFRPRSGWSRLVFDGAFNAQSSRFENTEFYLSSGGIAMMYKVGTDGNNPVNWEVHLINPGSGSGSGGGSAAGGGLMAGVEIISELAPKGSIPVVSNDSTNLNAGYIRVSSTIGISEIDHNSMAVSARYRRGNPMPWGAMATVCIALDPPTDDQVEQGSEKIIKVSGHIGPEFSLIGTADTNWGDIIGHISNYMDGINNIGELTAGYSCYQYSDINKGEVCLNYSLPYYSVTPVLTDRSNIFTTMGVNITGSNLLQTIVTKDYGTTSFLKFPGDSIRLRAVKYGSDNMWYIIQSTRVQDISIPLFIFRATPAFIAGTNTAGYRGQKKDGLSDKYMFGPDATNDLRVNNTKFYCVEDRRFIGESIFMNDKFLPAVSGGGFSTDKGYRKYNASISPYSGNGGHGGTDFDHTGSTASILLSSRNKLKIRMGLSTEMGNANFWKKTPTTMDECPRLVLNSCVPTVIPLYCGNVAQAITGEASGDILISPIFMSYENISLSPYGGQSCMALINNQGNSRSKCAYMDNEYPILLGGPVTQMANYVFHNVVFGNE